MLDLNPPLFCCECERQYQMSKLERCPSCNLELEACLCVPRTLKRLGVSATIKLVPYSTYCETVSKRAILHIKHHNNDRGVSFFATELADSINKYMTREQISPERTLVTNVPRSAHNIALFGFDQSEVIAKRVAKSLGCKYKKLFRRKHLFDREQKKLTAQERLENLQKTFCQADDMPKDCDTVFVIDDVMTTGASLAGCVILIKGRPVRIITATLGVTLN